MTPRYGFLFRHPRSALRAACATGALALVGCGGVDPLVTAGDAEATDPSVAAAPDDARHAVGSVEESLARLEALEVLETGALYATRTEHSWVPYGGIWSATEVPLDEEQVAERLAVFVDRAERAVADVGDPAVPTDASTLCWGGGDMYCLTRDAHAADLDALDALEIVEVEGMVRDDGVTTGACYSSWDTVTEDDCKRAYKLRAIVDATRDLPSRNPPEGEETP